MNAMTTEGLETKFTRFDDALSVGEGLAIRGYASRFGAADQSGDIVTAGAYAASLAAMSRTGRRVKMLWQHNPVEPIGVWEEVREDETGLFVSGRLLPEVARGREASALIAAGAIDGLSIGYRTVKSGKDDRGRRLLSELDLWEVSLVTFPMLPTARVGAKAETPGPVARELAALIDDATREMAGR